MPASTTLTRGKGPGSLGSRVYDALIGQIRAGELRSGERVLEESVAAELEVSRTPVREAFARLLARGFLENTTSGLAVASLDRGQVIELYAMREKLEGAAAAFAAENASAIDLRAIRHGAELFNAGGDDPQNLARANRMFHQAIYDAARNRYLMRMLEDLNDSLALLPDTTFQVAERRVRARSEHQKIVDAIARRDAPGAEDAACAHIRQALEGRLELLFASQGAPRS